MKRHTTNPIESFQENEQGFASIVIALILIIVLALLTVGFAQLARREQQNALDSQLATQANYAAESGLNDIYSAIASGNLSALNVISAGSGSLQVTPTDLAGIVAGPNAGSQCLTSSQLTELKLASVLNSTDGVQYTCALVNLTPPNLTKSPQAPNTTPWTTVFSTSDASANPGALDKLTITWSSHDGHNAQPPGTFPQLPPATSPGSSTYWGNDALPLLAVSITPLGDGTNLQSSNLINNTFTAYLYPSSSGSGSTVNYSSNSSNSNQDGSIVSASCQNFSQADASCSASIENLNGSLGEYYLLSVGSFYDIADISASATDSGGTQLDFTNAQAVIDVTGQAKNVLKRLRVVVPLNGVGGNPGNSNSSQPLDTLDAQNICKRFDTYPNSTTPDGMPGCSLN